MTFRVPRSIPRPAPGLVRRLVGSGLVTVVLLAGPQSAHAVTHLKRGMPAPGFVLSPREGAAVDLATLRDRVVVLVFGELYHEKTRKACLEVRTALAAEGIAAGNVTPLLVVTRLPEAPDPASRLNDDAWPLVLHDVDRRAYEIYRVSVMPSMVVIDRKGLVVHVLAGHTPRFKDIARDAIRLALGELDPEAFDATLRSGGADEGTDVQIRADRIARLARQLARRGLEELAEDKYREALTLQPDHGPARLGLGTLMLQHRRLAAAEREFDAALAADPLSIEASLGLAYVQTLRGGAELEHAEQRLRQLLREYPEEPRCHYLLGLVHEQQNRPSDAIGSFRRASELLMTRRDAWTVVPGELRDE